MRNQTISWRYVSIIIGLLLLLAVYKIAADLFINNVNSSSKKPIYIYIKSNKSLDRLLFNLQNENILKNVQSFERIAKLINLTDNLKAGRYKIIEGMSNIAIIKLLKSGRQEPLNLVIKYARRKENLALTISNQLELDSAELISLMNDSSTLSTAKMDSNNIIKIIPNLYIADKSLTDNNILKAFNIILKQEVKQ